MEQSHRRQEQGHHCRKLAAAGVERCCRPWAGRRGVPQCKGGRSRFPTAAYYSAREEGIGGTGTLRE